MEQCLIAAKVKELDIVSNLRELLLFFFLGSAAAFNDVKPI